MKSILFCRVSSKEQEETGYSLDAQEKLLSEYSEKKGFKTVKVFKVSESASGKMVRKLFMEMFSYANKNKISIICCEKIDRLTRNLKDASLVQDWIEEYKDEDREVHFLKESFILNTNTKAHENLVWDMKVAIARFYTNNLSEEVKKGQKEKISQGWLPTRPPLGYVTIGEKGHKTHIIDGGKGSFILEMFELYSSGNYSLSALSDVMYEKGLRNSAGKKVGRSRMHVLLTDPFYYGMIRWNNKVSQGKQKAIVNEDLFITVQNKISRKTKSPLYRKHLPVFKSKIACGECGGTIAWENQKGNWYGHCNHYKECEQTEWWRQEKTEEFLSPLFNDVAPKTKKVLSILEKAIKESHSNESEHHESTQKELNSQIEKSQHRIEAIYEDKIDGKITSDFYEKKFTEYTKDKENALKALQKLDEDNTKYYEAGYAIHELASKASEIYNSPKATTKDKRLLLSKIFSNLLIKDQEIKPEYTLAFEFLKEWTPVVNETFEPVNNGSTEGYKSTFYTSHPTVLPVLDKFRTLNWKKIKSELQFSGILEMFPSVALQN